MKVPGSSFASKKIQNKLTSGDIMTGIGSYLLGHGMVTRSLWEN